MKVFCVCNGKEYDRDKEFVNGQLIEYCVHFIEANLFEGSHLDVVRPDLSFLR